MNKVLLTGCIGKDLDLKYTQGSGTAIAKGTLAVKREFKKDETDWINLVAFGKIAETMAQYLTKGSKIGVVGRIQTGSYDAQDGTKRYTTDVIVESFEFLSSRSDKPVQENNNDLFEEPDFSSDNMPF